MKSQKLLWTALLLFFCCGFSRGQDSAETVKKLQAVASKIIGEASFQLVDGKTGKRYSSVNEIPSDAHVVPASRYHDWRYWNGLLGIAMFRMGESLDNTSYTDFAVKNTAFQFEVAPYFQQHYNNEGKWNYPFGEFFIMEELDDCGAMGASVIETYTRDRQQRYRTYIDAAADHIETKQSRLEDGTLVRSFPHRWTLWADDLYMGISFLCRMGSLTGDTKYFDDAARQVISFNNYLFDESKGLMTHCWYSDLKQRGVAYWGRANGWALLAQVDLLDHLPDHYPLKDTLISLVQRHIRGIAHYQSPNGLWHQLLDKSDSYEETSCSAMFTYTVARAVNKGYIDRRYASIARRGWDGVMTTIDDNAVIRGVCTGTVVENDLIYYYTRPTPPNDIHGIGVVLLAGIEMLDLYHNGY